MAKITKNDLAPSDAKHFSLANANFDVPFETDDPLILSNAEAHPWLTVERETVEQIAGEYTDLLDPADDGLSAQNSVANDPKAVKAHLESLQSDHDDTPLAVDAGLDQGEPETVGEGDNEVAVTLAADDTSSTSTRKKSSRSTTTDKD